MKEENTAVAEAHPEGELGTSGELPSKFRSVDALLHAYEALEAEFTRRSQRLRALEQANKAVPIEEQPSACETVEAGKGGAKESEARAVRTAPEGEERAEKPSELLKESAELPRVPLMTHSGTGVQAPQKRPKNFEEAGMLALGYLKNAKKGE